jgi:hypothetical protein
MNQREQSWMAAMAARKEFIEFRRRAERQVYVINIAALVVAVGLAAIMVWMLIGGHAL